MKVVILGGDGFCGWPTSLRFSMLGHDVTIVDNLSRRRMDAELGYSSLSPILSIAERLTRWGSVSGKSIDFQNIDLAHDYNELKALLREIQPDVIIHFAEQRSAPFSMNSDYGRRYTIDNNISATHNLLSAIVAASPDSHLVHLGTIGVYGYASAGFQLPEGYLGITGYGADGQARDEEILFPGRPDSVYHMSKLLDQHMFAFYARTYGLRCTDLHQGIVWGSQTIETDLHPDLINRFDYDPVYGTVVNRFLIQAANDFPMTVYGTGGQTRAFIHLRDTIRFIVAATETAPERGERPVIVNQASETCSIVQLAHKISAISSTELQFLNNPRIEPAQNDFHVDNSTLVRQAKPELGFDTDLAKEYNFVKSLARRTYPEYFLPRSNFEA